MAITQGGNINYSITTIMLFVIPDKGAFFSLNMGATSPRNAPIGYGSAGIFLHAS